MGPVDYKINIPDCCQTLQIFHVNFVKEQDREALFGDLQDAALGTEAIIAKLKAYPRGSISSPPKYPKFTRWKQISRMFLHSPQG